MKFEQIGKEALCRMPKHPSGSVNTHILRRLLCRVKEK